MDVRTKLLDFGCKGIGDLEPTEQAYGLIGEKRRHPVSLRSDTLCRKSNPLQGGEARRCGQLSVLSRRLRDRQITRILSFVAVVLSLSVPQNYY